MRKALYNLQMYRKVRDVLGTEAGQEVLHWLANECGVFDPSYVRGGEGQAAAMESAFQDGQKETVRKLMRVVNMSDRQLMQMHERYQDTMERIDERENEALG